MRILIFAALFLPGVALAGTDNQGAIEWGDASVQCMMHDEQGVLRYTVNWLGLVLNSEGRGVGRISTPLRAGRIRVAFSNFGLYWPNGTRVYLSYHEARRFRQANLRLTHKCRTRAQMTVSDNSN